MSVRRAGYGESNDPGSQTGTGVVPGTLDSHLL